ncbi:MAG: hypothetical protein HON14_00615 [Rhodospirillaceae bacterium]|jgi:hypothetical protein|nr:hypothetical protein [Rhodospirillaceae bacterium]MBT4588135.1 hypothetical protein [Rhodospirillaceae bacterium]MBT4937603.1 hypothetical protein [Rhodospirillaceae bacterium]MBT5939466.1 hypothetical protein [Rhodospirillaceae bacterium]MBT7266791.1 hypothetical protein [Rhodospirillaceae bacterium]
MSELIVTFSFVSLFVSIGVLWFVAEMTRRLMTSNKNYIDERFTNLLADMREMEAKHKKIGIAFQDLADEMESVKMSQQHSAGKELAITASLKEVAKQINSLDSMRKKATGTDG